MQTHNLIQGSAEWHTHRATHFNASDAPAMMGCSPYKTRSALLHEAHTGITPEVDAGTQRRFDDGHRFEALARPLAEAIIGQDLYPVTGSNGDLSASFDGLTMAEDLAWEHKSLNAALRDVLHPDGAEVGWQLPLQYRVQLEHQCAVSGAGRVLFMASKWNGDELVEERHCWYHADSMLREQIVAGWEQLRVDLATYAPTASVEPVAAGKAPNTLPALRIEVTGMVTASNLAEFKATALDAIRGVNRELTTDAEFADAEASVKWCADVESRLAAAKQHALSQTASIDALFKTIDDIASEARAVRLELDKLVTRRKNEVKEVAVANARKMFDAHIAGLNAEVAPMSLRTEVADFAGVIKGKRTMASVQDAIDNEMARAKIKVDAAAKALRANLMEFKQKAAGFEFLFADLSVIAHKPADDFGMVLQARIDAHKAAEIRRIEAERVRMEAEALRKVQAEEGARIAEEQRVADRKAREAQAMAAAAVGVVASPAQYPAPAVAPSVARMPAPVAPSGRIEPATLNLGAICARLGFTISGAFVADTLGIQHAATDKAAKLYRESQFPMICAALTRHIVNVQTSMVRA
ncbi:MAG: YqaJ viral recombinase family protein [Ramlibacter sp.]|nr:YqaJ viral recombinase family protein [Ramlibacter sp.]